MTSSTISTRHDAIYWSGSWLQSWRWPKYDGKFDLLLTEWVCYHELSSWQKRFEKPWRKLEETPITMPINDTYQREVEEWVSTCPAFPVSHFLLCKHLVSGHIRFLPSSSLKPCTFVNCPSGGTKPWGHWRNIAMIQQQLLGILLREGNEDLIWVLKGLMMRMREVSPMKRTTTMRK